jgi:hypothetical protein
VICRKVRPLGSHSVPLRGPIEMLDAGRRAAASYADIQFECLQRVENDLHARAASNTSALLFAWAQEKILRLDRRAEFSHALGRELPEPTSPRGPTMSALDLFDEGDDWQALEMLVASQERRVMRPSGRENDRICGRQFVLPAGFGGR